MARPSKVRMVAFKPKYYEFKPKGVPSTELEKVELAMDELEAVRLADYEGLDHEEAAELMGISRPTFSRLVEKARRKVAEMLIESKELVIEGGSVEFVRRHRCRRCGKETGFLGSKHKCKKVEK
ncbi:DUF134 domain-containing protein [Deferribacter autotrophicus]|uniref:UPF0251 protein FHQ18_10820 n=1 Tax=Deferribacter autotrophicus TaxID=500465 RepID=A0A5A8F067_9BACT|nr:DUF134 domain-containing protein [Deferribacter autotrophicus]KAA0257053.1 DUF134 domain-containing protein [Deferribacter autotrophicus]